MATEKLNTWRLRQLVDEPLYCAAPKLEELDDNFVCYDSDEPLSESGRLAKRLRYEAAGQRYLDGHRPRLISASLRGPFDAKSGWINPWLPKTSKTGMRSTTIPLTALDNQCRAASCEQIITLTQTANLNQSTINTCANNSVRDLEPLAILPSQFLTETPNVHLRIEKRTRIQAWAESVELGLPDDDKDFWNPQEKSAVQGHDSVQAGNDTARNLGWLKKTPLKRKRSGKSPATSPQASKKPVTLNRSVSDSAATYHKAPISLGVLRKETSSILLSQSFELTPSSLADPLPLSHLREGQLAPVSESDYPSTAGDTICPRIRNRETSTVQESSGVKETNNYTTLTTKDESLEATIEALLPADENEMQDDAIPQAGPVVPDESSFRYRIQRPETRSNETSLPERSTNTLNLTQTETPESSHHPDESIKPADPAQTSGSEQIVADTAENAEIQNHGPESMTTERSQSTKSSNDDAVAIPSLSDLVDAVKGPADSSTSYNATPVPATTDAGPSKLPSDAAEALQHDVEMQNHDKATEEEEETAEASLDIIVDVAEELVGSAHTEFFDLQATAASAVNLSQSENLAIPEVAQQSEVSMASTVSATPVVQREVTCAQSPSSKARPVQLASLFHSIDEGDEKPEVTEEVTASEKIASPQHAWALPASQRSPRTAENLQKPLSYALVVDSREVESPTAHRESTPLRAMLDINPGTESRRDSLDLGIQLKSFSHFNTSPPRSHRIKKLCNRNSTGQLRGILSTKSSLSPWSRRDLNDDSYRRASYGVRRRVTFAPLPGSTGEEYESQDHAQPTVRAASPPPAMSFSAADEDVTDQFKKHFESVKKNKSSRRSSSQPLVPTNAGKETTVDTVHTAHEPVSEAVEDSERQTPCPGLQTRETTLTPTREPAKDLTQQSPWRADTQTDQMDDVAAVMGNLDAFLDAWDVDTEMQRASQGMDTDKENQSQEKGKDKLGGNNRFGLQELSIWN